MPPRNIEIDPSKITKLVIQKSTNTTLVNLTKKPKTLKPPNMSRFFSALSAVYNVATELKGYGVSNSATAATTFFVAVGVTVPAAHGAMLDIAEIATKTGRLAKQVCIDATAVKPDVQPIDYQSGDCLDIKVHVSQSIPTYIIEDYAPTN